MLSASFKFTIRRFKRKVCIYACSMHCTLRTHISKNFLNILAQVAPGVDKLSTSFQTIIATVLLVWHSLCLARWLCCFFCCKRSSYGATCSVLFLASLTASLLKSLVSIIYITHSLTYVTHQRCRARLQRKRVVWYCLLRCIILSYSYFLFH